MNNRVTSDSANSVSLFPFLAVLLCTMGALLVLLVVLAQRAGQRVAAEGDLPAVTAASLPQPASVESSEAAKLQEQLHKVRDYQKRLAELRKQADLRLLEEQQRLTHSEAHARRLEHELARLSLAAEQMKATEQDQSVDQEQAERELARLRRLLKDTEARLKDLREQSRGKPSYAIVPYRGPNGTYRKPIYIECRNDAIILHPEGIRLQSSDFADTSWPGNPLAAALRATRDHVNAQAAQAGAAEPPDPYPMILVRPDGIRQYALARAAIKSWDASYGYEFIDGDWELNFPELPDPQLAQIQQHAIYLARDRLARLIRSAPSRFGRSGPGAYRSGPSGPGGRGGISGPEGLEEGHFSGELARSEFVKGDPLGQSQAGGSKSGTGVDGHWSNSDTTTEFSAGEENRELQLGAMAGEPSEAGESDASVGLAAGTSDAAHGLAEGSLGDTGERYAQREGSVSAGGSSEGNSAAAGGAENSGSRSRSAASASNGSTPTAGGSAADGQSPSIAETHGRNWAVPSGSLSAVAIRRPIQVVIRQDQLALLPSRHTFEGDAANGRVISLDQSTQEISNEFVTALRGRVEEWGLAGHGLYWRPVLKLNVGPGAEQTANQVLRLLKDSGVDVSLPETARAPQRGNLGGTIDATR